MGPRETWHPFRMRDLPLDEEQEKHDSVCPRCREIWHLSALAIHEATHAAVAQRLGLKVKFVAIDEEQEIEVTKLEAALYPLIQPGMKIPAMATRLSEDSLRRHPEGVLVAMVAPSCVHTGHPHIDEYAAVESCIAIRRAKTLGLDGDTIFDRAKVLVEECQDRILELADQLADTGWVDL